MVSACASIMTGTALDSFLSRLESSAADFTYAYRIERSGSPDVTSGGRTVMKGTSYRTDADGLEIYCDGTVVWTVDRDSREVVIETCDQSRPGASGMNPLLLLRQFDKIFSVTGSDVSVDGNGREIHTYRLEADSSLDMKQLVVSISAAGDAIFSARMEMKDGTVIDCTIPSFSFSSAVDDGIFSLDTGTLDSSYIVTDLR